MIKIELDIQTDDDVYELYHLLHSRYIDLKKRRRIAPTDDDKQTMDEKLTRWFGYMSAVGLIYHDLLDGKPVRVDRPFPEEKTE